MARIVDKNIIGAVGPVVFREHRGTNTLRAKNGPGLNRQTEETKKAAGLFGDASRFAAQLRHELGNSLHFLPDGEMVNRLNRQMGIILRRHRDPDTLHYDFHARSFKSLVGFEFNMKSQLKEQLWTLPETRLLNGKLRVTLPQIDIKKDLHFPNNANSCTIFLNIQYGALKDEYEKIPDDEMNPILEISKDDTHTVAQEWTFDIPEGCYCVTSIALNYHKKWRRYQLSVNNAEMSPAMICDFSVNPGTFAGKPDKTWWESYFCFKDKAPKKVKTKAKKNTHIMILADDDQAGTEAKTETSVPTTAQANPCCLSSTLNGDNPFITFPSAKNEAISVSTTKELSGQVAAPEWQEAEQPTKASIRSETSPNTQQPINHQAQQQQPETNHTIPKPKATNVPVTFPVKNISFKDLNPQQTKCGLPLTDKNRNSNPEEDG